MKHSDFPLCLGDKLRDTQENETFVISNALDEDDLICLICVDDGRIWDYEGSTVLDAECIDIREFTRLVGSDTLAATSRFAFQEPSKLRSEREHNKMKPVWYNDTA